MMNWKEFSRTCGHDVEMRERRQAAATKQWWDNWVRKNVAMSHDHVARTLNGVQTILPDEKELIWKAILCRMSVSIIENKTWYRSRKSCSGMFVRPITYYPYRALAYDMAYCSGLCNNDQLNRTVAWGKRLFPEEGLLQPDCSGSFWHRLFAEMPPYSAEDVLHVEPDSSVTRKIAPGEEYQRIDQLRWGIFYLFVIEAHFAGIDQVVPYLNTRLQWFEQNWKRLCGTKA